MIVTIEVTATDIEDGEPEEGDICPIALAARRLLPSLPDFYVGTEYFYPHGSPDPEGVVVSLMLGMPPEALSFVEAFDEHCPDGDICEDGDCTRSHVGGTPAPFSFELDVPDELLAVTP